MTVSPKAVRIHVNRASAQSNEKRGTDLAPITVLYADGRHRDCRGVSILGPSRIVYDPSRAYAIGHGSFSIWIETDAEVELVEPAT